ncbi:MAG: TetR/AcrR family transcriptional regulator [Steroidobacteraceae bacterium]|jgi:AcrR family transcriptional regulator
MSYISQRRGEEKERRRAEILDAAEALYAKTGWEAVTVDQVARSARLSRGLVYVYFHDKEDLLFAIGERAMQLLRDRFGAAVGGPGSGLEHVEAIGRAYTGYALEFPHYFDFCSRFQSRSMGVEPGANESACRVAGDQVIARVVEVIESGIRDGSIRADVGDPLLLAFSLWAFTHGVTQLVIAKAADLARQGVAISDFSDHSFRLLISALQPRRQG